MSYFPPRVNPDKMFIMSGVAARIKKVVGRFFSRFFSIMDRADKYYSIP